MNYEVAIIGAGPAGLMAARTLADSSISFIAIDSKKQIGLPLKCGEGIRTNGFLELFKHKDYDFIKNKTEKFVVFAGKTKRTIPVEYLMLDRPKFEQWLAKPVIKKIMLNTNCRDLIKKQDCIEIITDKGKIKSNMVILADGCRYSIQKKFGLMKSNPLLIPCYGGILENHGLDKKNLYFFFDEANFSALWVFPKDNNKANVGIGAYNQKANIRELFKKAIKKYNLKLKGRPSYAGIFPNSGPIRQTYADRLLVCGNAAGQVYAGSGEGIYFALKSGKLAAETAVKAVKKRNFKSFFLKQYETAWKKSFGNELKASLIFNRILLFGFNHKKFGKIFMLPTRNDLINLLGKGKIPIKAKIAHFLINSPSALRFLRIFLTKYKRF